MTQKPMRPILLKGHERPLTFIKYNREGDLLFSCSKDSTPCVWYADSGERVGTYRGHHGSVWSLDIDWDTTRLITGSADNSTKLWDAQTGTDLFTIPFRVPVRSVGFNHGDRLFFAVTDRVMGVPATIHIFRHSYDVASQSDVPLLDIKANSFPEANNPKIMQALWGPLNERIYTANEDGSIILYDPETGKLTDRRQDHTHQVNKISFATDYSTFITASSDKSAKLYDTRTLEVIKTYTTDRPINSAVMSPLDEIPMVLLGGGQDADMVTTTSSRIGNFQVRLYHKFYCNELGSIKGHFGPIHTIAWNPNGKSYASGSEDGYIRLHHFDPSFFQEFADHSFARSLDEGVSKLKENEDLEE